MEGTCFYIELHLASVSKKHPEPLAVKLPNQKHKEILYFDNVSESVTKLKELLSARQNWKVISAKDVKTGIDFANLSTPSLILIDVNVLDATGLPALKEFCQTPEI